MKPLKSICLLLALLMVAPVMEADAQLGKRLKKRAKDRAKERIERKAERQVDKSVDKTIDTAEQKGRDAVEGMFKGGDDQFATELNLGAIASSPADADNLTYQETTQLWFPGMKFLARFSKDLKEPSVKTYYYTKTHSRTDEGDNSTILDANDLRFTVADHKEKTFFSYTLDEMASASSAIAAQATADLSSVDEDEGEEDEDREEAMDKINATYDFSVDIRETGVVENILTTDASQVLVIIRTDVQATDEETREKVGGQFYTILDTWKALNVAGRKTIESLHKNMAEGFSSTAMFQDSQDKLATMPLDPRVMSSMEKASEELAKIEGFAVRTGTYFVIVPDGQELDINKAMETSGGSLAGLAPQDGESSEQVTVLKSITHVHDLHTNPHPSGLFAIDTSTYEQINPLAMFADDESESDSDE